MHPASPSPRARAALRAAAVLAFVVLVAGCATRPARDGPGPNPPAGLERVPDATPRVEAWRNGGPNKPYEIGGSRYTPLLNDRPLRERGGASWYGRKFQGLPTASGEPYDMYAMTAAHRTLPIPSYARVRNPANGREVIVRINDRGPFSPGRVIDLSYTAALRLGVLGGVAPVEVERLTNEDIRSGRWQRAGAAPGPGTDAGPESAAMADEPEPAPAAAAASAGVPPVAPGPGFWLQLGAFRQQDGALTLQQRVQAQASGLVPGVALLDDRAVVRVQAGPYPTRDAALAAAERLHERLRLTPLLIERPNP